MSRASNFMHEFRREANAERAARADHLDALRAEIRGIGQEVATMLGTFRTSMAEEAAADRQQRHHQLDALRSNVQTVTQEARRQMKQFQVELQEAAAQNRVDRADALADAEAFVARNRKEVRQLLDDIRMQLASLREASGGERHAFVEEVQSTAHNVLNTARQTLEDVQDEMEDLHRNWRAPSPSADGAEDSGENEVVVLKGIGPKTAAQLRDAGIVTFQDLAAHSPDEIRNMLSELPAFVDVDSWVEQARRQVRASR